ncbi:MAG: DUF1800 domain-containing protein [Planctomycetota bacterium]
MMELNSIDPEWAWAEFEPDRQNLWDRKKAAHLFRRSAFTGTADQIDRSVRLGMKSTLDQLFDQAGNESIDPQMATAGRLITGGSDAKSLASWWLLRMLKTKSPLLEVMTFFWHGHFATGAEKVMDSRAMLRQNELLRKHALGEFESFVKAISSDVAMLVYLDSQQNRKTRPNENYARELMELFCLGTGNYTESDIKEIARCFTGWEIRRGKFRFNKYQHDTKQKSFLGKSGDFDGNRAVEIVLQQPAAAEFIARKLVRHFVFDNVDISSRLLDPLTRKLRSSQMNISVCVKKIMTSNLFYSKYSIGRKIKSPVELAVGFLRFLNASTNVNQLADRLLGLGQLPFYPPNVKGWPGGKTWINASSILGRANLLAEILVHDKTKFRAGSVDNWFEQALKSYNGSTLEWFEEYLLATSLADATKQSFARLEKNTEFGAAQKLAWLVALPEFQLS